MPRSGLGPQDRRLGIWRREHRAPPTSSQWKGGGRGRGIGFNKGTEMLHQEFTWAQWHSLPEELTYTDLNGTSFLLVPFCTSQPQFTRVAPEKRLWPREVFFVAVCSPASSSFCSAPPRVREGPDLINQLLQSMWAPSVYMWAS